MAWDFDGMMSFQPAERSIILSCDSTMVLGFKLATPRNGRTGKMAPKKTRWVVLSFLKFGKLVRLKPHTSIRC